MAEVKNYGLSGVHRTLQLGKQGPVLVGNADTDSFSVTLQDAATLTNMSGANATSGTHFITKSQLDAVYTEATFLANVNYNDSSPILLGNISYGTKTIITTFEVTTAFDASAVVTIGDSSDNSLLMSDNYAEIEVPGTYQTINTVEFTSNSTLNIYVTQGGATQGFGTVLVSVVDGPVVNGGAINYGSSSSGIALTDLSVSSNSPSGNGSLSYDNTTGVFTFTPANVNAGGSVTASSNTTFTNKTINIQSGQGNDLQIQGQSLSSYTGTGPTIVFDTNPTLNAFNIGNGSGLTVDGGTGTSYWSGISGVAQAGDKKAGVYHTSSTSNNGLFTFGINGSGTMSLGVEGSLFLGTSLPANHGGVTTANSGWLVLAGGIKSGGDFNTLGGVTATGNISSSGNVSASYFVGNGSLLTGITAGTNYTNSNVVSLLSSFGSNTLVTTGNVTAGNITTDAGKNVYLGNASSLFRQLGSNSYISLNQNVTLAPDTTASATSGVTIGGSGYILGPNNARNMTLNYGASGIVGFQSNIVLGTAGNASLNVPGITSTGISAVVAGVTNTLLPNTIASFSANVNNYTQVTLQNKSTGGDATADFIITADNGSDTTNYADFGIINSGYDNTTPSNSLGNIVFAADTYLYAQGNASNTSQPGGNLAIGTTTVGKTVKVFAGGANSNSVIGTFSNTGLVVSGNVTANNFSGNISITGNIAGTSPNVSLVAGNFTATFDNTGLLTLPTMGGDEGGEINFGIPTANTSLSGTVKLDVYRDRIRFFDGSTKGAYIDLSQAGSGVSTLLNNRVSGYVNAGTYVTMDNLKATVTTTGNRGLSLATVSGTVAGYISGNFNGVSVGNGGAAGSVSLSTTASSSIFNWNFPSQGDTITYILNDNTNNRCYRITLQIGASYNNNMISIERLI